MKQGIIICMLAALTLSSCAVTQKTATASTTQVDTKIYNVTIADLDVKSERATATTQWQWNMFSTFSLSKVKKDAEAELLNATESDVIVEPRYEVERRGLFRGGSITVSGYPARYCNYHTITESEAKAIVTLDTPQSNTEQVVTFSKLKPSKSLAKVPTSNSYSVRPKSFFNAIAGPSIEKHDSELGYSIGLMYGRHRKSWGWYVKGSYSSFEGEKITQHESQLTFGVVKPFSNTFSLFAGAGVGYIEGDFYYYYHHSYYDCSGVSVPFDLGMQFSIQKFNIVAGVSYSINTQETYIVMFKPFVGIGFCF